MADMGFLFLLVAGICHLLAQTKTNLIVTTFPDPPSTFDLT
jgi:hypothetical protein